MGSEKDGKLLDLYLRIQRDPLYRSKKMGSIFVPGVGAMLDRPVAFIGEAPGSEEEKARSPFVGAAGRNLNQLLRRIELQREQVFITNLVKYRPLSPTGGNRTPTNSESRCALPYLLQELEILRPRMVVCLGLTVSRALLDDPRLKMADANATLFDKHGMKILVSYHPSPFNFRVPDKKAALLKAFGKLSNLM